MFRSSKYNYRPKYNSLGYYILLLNNKNSKFYLFLLLRPIGKLIANFSNNYYIKEGLM
jgi:hypothetical protein